MTAFATIEALRASIISSGHLNADYAARMVHDVPKLETKKDRLAWLVEKAKGRVVLDIGCGTGPVSDAIKASALKYYGVDCITVPGCDVLDIDHHPDELPKYPDVDMILAAEVLEHLGNPGWFLLALSEKYPGVELVLTVPNAGGYQTHNGSEVVNGDHVAWYSYTTIKTLLRRYHYAIAQAQWYNGEPHKAEGLIIEATPA